MLRSVFILVFIVTLFCGCKVLSDLNQNSVTFSSFQNDKPDSTIIVEETVPNKFIRGNSQPSGLLKDTVKSTISSDIYLFESNASQNSMPVYTGFSDQYIPDPIQIDTLIDLGDEKVELKEADASLTMGIVAIISAALAFTGIGFFAAIILGITSITKGRRAAQIIEKDPDHYLHPNRANVAIGLGIAALVLDILWFILLMVYLFFIISLVAI